MANHTDILIENLKETLKSAQTYLVTGNGAALFLLLLATQGKLAKGTPEQDVSIPFVGLSAPTFSAAFIALAIYLLSGMLVLGCLAHSKRIQERLSADCSGRALLDAVLTYPSLLTMSLRVQMGAALLPACLGACALLLAYYDSHGFLKAALTGALFASPYLLLTWRLFSARGK